jgi:glycosyltransferase involved in cell wall biosynthesis
MNIFNQSSKCPPISFVYRLKNADPFLELSVASIIPIANEIIFVDNGSEDHTLDVIQRLILRYSDKVNFKVENYPHDVCRQGPDYADALKLNNIGSLASYYNFCFNIASNEWVFKIDAHKILLPESYDLILDKILKGNQFIFLRGYDLHGRNISYEPLLYNTCNGVNYVDGKYFEQLDYKKHLNDVDIYNGRIEKPCFLHVKSIINTSY